ncbi:MAG: hypothetical protein H2069_08485 [Legionella sp.]|nr:hypothetical protein [Legionella sp.]
MHSNNLVKEQEEWFFELTTDWKALIEQSDLSATDVSMQAIEIENAISAIQRYRKDETFTLQTFELMVFCLENLLETFELQFAPPQVKPNALKASPDLTLHYMPFKGADDCQKKLFNLLHDYYSNLPQGARYSNPFVLKEAMAQKGSFIRLVDFAAVNAAFQSSKDIELELKELLAKNGFYINSINNGIFKHKGLNNIFGQEAKQRYNNFMQSWNYSSLNKSKLDFSTTVVSKIDKNNPQLNP